LSPYEEAVHWVKLDVDKPGLEKRYVNEEIGKKKFHNQGFELY
jgi:hypothetical protein